MSLAWLATAVVLQAGPLDLEVRRAPREARLAMRAAATDTPPDAEPARPRSRPARAIALVKPLVAQDLEELERRVVFRLQLGYAVEQGDTTSPSLWGGAWPGNRDTRLYTYGDGVLGTNGILARPLSSYFAARFRFDQDRRPGGVNEMGEACGASEACFPNPSSIPSIYDQSALGGAVFVRHAYAQLGGLGEGWTKSIRIRAGRQYRYGIGVAHFDGVTAAYETTAIDLGVHVGRRVVLYTSDQYRVGGTPDDELAPAFDDPGLISGASARIRLAPITGAPVVVRGDALTVDEIGHFHASMAVSPRPDITLLADGRTRDGKLARLIGTVRARLSDVTILSAEVDERRPEDWLYDFTVTGAEPWRATDPRGFLLLGEAAAKHNITPRMRLSGRAGTVLFGNFDVYANAALGFPHGQDDPPTSFVPSYVEVGAAVEARFRGGLSGGADFLIRRFAREIPKAPPSTVTPMDRLALVSDAGLWGEIASRSATAHMGYSVGEKSFSIEGLLYGKSYDDLEYDQSTQVTTTRVGGLIQIEAWVGKRMRTLIAYDVTGVLGNLASELAGIHTVRILGEATF